MQKVVKVEIQIKTVTMKNVPTDQSVVVLWKRGKRSIDTKRRKLGPKAGYRAVFDDKF
jgi:hypothetical protein